MKAMKNITAYFLFTLLSMGCALSGYAQNPVDPVPVGFPMPVWVKMMDDSTVNFYQAKEAFERYWRTNRKPKGESEEMEEAERQGKDISAWEREEAEKRRKNKRRESKLPAQSLEVQEYLKYQMKRFENWALEVKPWVQENGHILTFYERQQMQEKNSAGNK
jgi:hypothetical protein